MTVVTVGIDLAKMFSLWTAWVTLAKLSWRAPMCHAPKLLELVAHGLPCLIGMEACGGAHHWARKFAEVRPHDVLDGTEVRRTLSHERPNVAKTTQPMQPPCVRHSPTPICALCRSKLASVACYPSWVWCCPSKRL